MARLASGRSRALHAPRRRAALFAAALALLPVATARAEDPAPAPAPAPPAETAPVTVETDRVERPDGWVVRYYHVNFVDPGTLRSELDRWKTPQAKIEPMGPAVGNVLRIEERRENLALLEKMLQVLDQPTPQVLVRAKLVEISYDGNLEWGFDAAFDRAGVDPLKSSETAFRGASGTFNPDAFLNASAVRPYQGSELAFAFLGDTKSRYGSLDVVIRALKSSGKAEILGEPNILATQGQEAKLSAGEDVPIQTSALSGNAVVVTGTVYKETGISLLITPDLIGRDAVRLKLKQEFSAVTGFLAGQGGVQNPIINKRSANTTVTVRDGATLVVGGLQSSRSREVRSGIPLLMDIPGLGYLFSSSDREEVKTELYFFLTVEIVRGSYAEGVIAPPGEKARLEGLGGTR